MADCLAARYYYFLSDKYTELIDFFAETRTTNFEEKNNNN